MRVRVPFLCVLWCIALNGCSAFRLIDIGDEMFQATTGVLQSIPRVIPSPTQFFSMSKNIIFGLPFDITFNLINNFCKLLLNYSMWTNESFVSGVLGTAALNSRTISVKPKYTPDIKSLTFILRTRKENITIPLTNPDELWNHASFDLNLPLVIFVTGWKTDLKEKVSTAQETLAAAYLCRGNVNFVVSCCCCISIKLIFKLKTSLQLLFSHRPSIQVWNQCWWDKMFDANQMEYS